MKTIKGKLRITISAVLVTLMSSLAMAQSPGLKQGQKCKMLPGLTEEQKEKISDMRSEHMKNMVQLRADAKVLKAELDQLTIANKPNMDKINAKIDELSTKKAEIAKAKYKHLQNVRSQLTDEQRTVFDVRSANKRFRRGNGHKQGHRQHLAYGQNRANSPIRGQRKSGNGSQK